MLREVPKKLYVGNSWISDETNRENLRLFLSQHRVDINNTVGIVFRDKSFTVEVFVRDSQGRIQASDQGVTLTTKKTVQYVGRRPDLLPNEDWKRASGGNTREKAHKMEGSVLYRRVPCNQGFVHNHFPEFHQTAALCSGSTVKSVKAEKMEMCVVHWAKRATDWGGIRDACWVKYHGEHTRPGPCVFKEVEVVIG